MIQNVKTRDEFNQLIKEGNVLVDFYGSFCAPCARLAPELDLLSKDHPNLKIVKVDVEDLPEIATQYGVRSIPAMFVLKDGVVVKNMVGFKTKEALESEIK